MFPSFLLSALLASVPFFAVLHLVVLLAFAFLVLHIFSLRNKAFSRAFSLIHAFNTRSPFYDVTLHVFVALALKDIDYEYKAVHLVQDGGQQVGRTFYYTDSGLILFKLRLVKLKKSPQHA